MRRTGYQWVCVILPCLVFSNDSILVCEIHFIIKINAFEYFSEEWCLTIKETLYQTCGLTQTFLKKGKEL
jgi:hypothetical protein